ncbi:hypothetical protein [Deinococcus cavernae]
MEFREGRCERGKGDLCSVELTGKDVAFSWVATAPRWCTAPPAGPA